MKEEIIRKLDEVEEKYNELTEKLASPEVFQDHSLYAELSREQATLEPIVKKYRQYKETLKAIAEAEEL
ncbi:MAG: PCRF domain-containing protein, partial [Nitrospirae bacterium]